MWRAQYLNLWFSMWNSKDNFGPMVTTYFRRLGFLATGGLSTLCGGVKRGGFFRNIGKVCISSSGALAPLVFSFFFFVRRGLVFRTYIFSAVFEVRDWEWGLRFRGLVIIYLP